MTAEHDLEVLAATAIENAQHLLADEGGFPPFGIGIEIGEPDDDPELALVEIEDEEGDEPAAEEIFSALIETFGDDSESWRAVAVAFESETDDGRDAIGVILQHREGVGLDVYLPYTQVGDEVHYDEPVQADASLAIWGEPGD